MQSFVNTVESLASLAYVGLTNPGQLLDAAGQAVAHPINTLLSIGRGIETWWGNLTSGDPYRAGEATGDLLQQILPFAGEVRDVQLTGDVLEADGVVARCTDGINCFLAGTQVVTGVNANGSYQTESIQNITVGQMVLTKNQNDPNGPLQEETVTAVQVHTVYALRDVTIKNADGSVETIDTTDSHPFYVQGQGWVSADDLLAGETLSTPDGQTATVIGTTSVAETQGVLVYNFTVADDHTYFVEGFGDSAGSGTTGSFAPLDAVWVHNSCNPLRRNFIRAGFKVAGQAAHHIVAQGAKAAVRARAILVKFGIDVNSLENGVLLKQAFHAGIHTKKYYTRIQSLLKRVVAKGGTNAEIQANLIAKLKQIANSLKNGKLP